MLGFMDGFDAVDTPLYRWSAVGTPTITMLPAVSTRLGQGQAVRITSPSSVNGISRGFSGAGTVIVGFAARFAGGTGSNAPGVSLLGDTGVTTHTSVRFDVTAGTIIALRGTISGSTILGSVAAGVNLALWNYYEVRCVLSDTVGEIEVRVNGAATPVLSLTAQDTKNAGTGTVYDTLRLITSLTAGAEFDDVVIVTTAGSAPLNTFLGDVSIKTLLPTGAGATTQLTSSSGGANWTNVDDAQSSMTDSNSSATDNQQDTYTMADLTGSGTVLAVQANLLASKSDAGAKSVAPVLRIGGTDYAGTDKALATTAGILSQLYETSPAGGAWSVATINSMEAGARVRP